MSRVRREQWPLPFGPFEGPSVKSPRLGRGILTLHGILGGAILAMPFGCARPPMSPVAGIQPSQVATVCVEASNGCIAELTSSAEVGEFVSTLEGAEPFRQGKVASDHRVTLRLIDGRTIQLRMGPDQIGPPVAGSDVVWRWRLPDARAYAIVSQAIERSRKDGRCSPTSGCS
jgi:hypothetical protein